MGEAKRRKGFGSTNGENANKRQSEIWFNQMSKNLPSWCKPDYGHIVYKNFPLPNRQIHFLLCGEFMCADDPSGKMLFSATESSAVSILMTNTQFKEFMSREKRPALLIQLAIKERYQAKSGEWVLPFKTIEIKKD
jgi:hypothetical protein